MKDVAIAHGSLDALRALERTLAKLISVRVLWKASDGRAAVETARSSAVALLLLDARIQRPSASEVVRTLAGTCPVLLLQDGSPQATASVYDALAAGALDVAPCPSLDAAGKLVGESGLLAKLRTMDNVLSTDPRPAPSLSGAPKIVLIGSSTGGPQALQTVLGGLPRDFDAAIMIAQHVDREFTPGLASWLARETRLDVRLARSDDVPTAGTVLIAGTNDHLVLSRRKRLVYTDQPIDAPYRPSADELFSSFAQHWDQPGVAALLTGMGRDGAQGLLKLRRCGWRTIAQDAASSVVFGMPKAAIELGAAEEVASIGAIAEAIMSALRRSRPARPSKG